MRDVRDEFGQRLGPVPFHDCRNGGADRSADPGGVNHFEAGQEGRAEGLLIGVGGLGGLEERLTGDPVALYIALEEDREELTTAFVQCGVRREGMDEVGGKAGLTHAGVYIHEKGTWWGLRGRRGNTGEAVVPNLVPSLA